MHKDMHEGWLFPGKFKVPRDQSGGHEVGIDHWAQLLPYQFITTLNYRAAFVHRAASEVSCFIFLL